ncbi:MAG: C10 family peptidase, partial [Bacteroidales bacterium]|nr:C10 family peptidase [Bacteroidales bacterium]
MKFKNLLFSLLLIFVVSGVFSGEVDVQKAKNMAFNFYFEKANQYNQAVDFHNLAIINIINKKAESINVYYVVTFNQQGFVIVSADDVLPPVLGYSLKGSYNDNNAPDSYKNFMKSYADAVIYVRENKIQQTDDVYQQWNYYLTGTPEIFLQPKEDKSVDPLLLCKWNQGFPYNALCPVDPIGPGGHVYAGCVATAMAQVIYYWRHPLQGTGSHSYYYYPYGSLSANFGATTYEWFGMKNSIDHTYAVPIAELQYQCGVAVEMMYGPGGSGAYSSDVPYALTSYF